MQPLCSVIICTHNRYDLLDEAISSIEMQACPREQFELVIVDNSTDLRGQGKFLDVMEISCEHRYVREVIPGLSRARNIGTKLARGELVAFMDDDAQASTQWVQSIIAAFGSRDEIGVVGGPVQPVWPAARPPWLHSYLEGFLTIVDRGNSRRLLDENEWLAGTNIAFRKESLIAAGLFNENLGRVGRLLLSNEDLSVCAKVRALGFHILYDPAVEMLHTVHSERLNHAWMRRRVFWQAVSDIFSEGGSVELNLTDGVDKILDYQQKLPPKDRGVAGFFLNVDDPGLFHQQLEAFQHLVRLMATSGLDWRGYLTDARKS